MNARFVQACAACVFATAVSAFSAQEPSSAGGRNGREHPYHDLVPHYLLSLVHAPEVHAELGLSKEQVLQLESLLREIDAVWFPARILLGDRQRAVVVDLESRVRAWFETNASASQRKRLDQLEYYAQGGRMLLRSDVSQQIGLSTASQTELADLARATDEAQQKLARTEFGDPALETLRTAVIDSVQAERQAQSKLIDSKTRQKLSDLLGAPFDPSKLKRIYAMAPEFVRAEHWVNSPPLRLADLKDKVVLVHFYAFQCHNCHANFAIYQRWHDELADKGVVVIGIQTPETQRERDPGAVEAAAVERKLSFPILVDLDSENWKAWGNTMWPTVYVVDQNGYIRHWWQGELNWKGATADKTIEAIVDALLVEGASNGRHSTP